MTMIRLLRRILLPAAAFTCVVAACGKEKLPPAYESVQVERRTIVVVASAAGAIEPVRTVDVKSKASGEIIEMRIETGDDVKPGQLMAVVDPRQPRNAVAQAEANLEVANAQLTNAQAQLTRADTLFKSQAITEVEHEDARLNYANANAQAVRTQVALETAQDQMDDTRIRAPVSGTIITKNVELGTVISSPTSDVGGGTVLFKMANLDTVQVRGLVDETDIGKVQPGLQTTITVDAYPRRPFRGEVQKIEPEATVLQNVTMFPVLVRIANPEHMLKPGMNTEVEIHVGRREDVLTVPYSALRTRRDVASAAAVLGVDPVEVEEQLAAARQAAPALPAQPEGGAPRQVSEGGGGTAAAGRMQATGGVQGAGQSQRQPGQTQRTGRDRSFRRGSADADTYIVFVLRNGRVMPVEIRTGLTDLDYIEVLSGLAESDTVAVLPSASLVNSQREMRERFQRMTGGGGIPGMQQQPTPGQQQPQQQQPQSEPRQTQPR